MSERSMDELERRVADDLKNELLLGKREKQRLSEKLDCLILLIGRAWQGESESINKISEIVGIPAPKIIPASNEHEENELLGQEYLQLTSSLLDQQLKDDVSIKKKTRVLRPSSAHHCEPTGSRVSSASLNHRILKDTSRSRAAVNKKSTSYNIENQATVNALGKIDHKGGGHIEKTYELENFSLANFTDVLPMFVKPENKVLSPISTNRLSPNAKENIQNISQKYGEKNIPAVLFDPNGIVEAKKTRPVSAALQHRQDYVRSQTRKKKPRVQSAKPAFRHATDLEYDTLVRTHAPIPSPASSPENAKNPSPRIVNQVDDAQPISVNISAKGRHRVRIANITGMYFPNERDDHALGDVSDALQHVQEMERLFRRNTRRLQQRIGIPAAGCI